MQVFDPQTRTITISSLRAFQNLFAALVGADTDSVQLSIAFSKVGPDGNTTLLDTIDTGGSTARGQADSGYRSDNIGFNGDEQRGALAAMTVRAWTDVAVHQGDPDIVATGTIQVHSSWTGNYTNMSVEVRQVNNAMHLTWLVTRPS
jgi:hypothetical protein